ncbi:PREDICTED: small lysine-rich protein 1, partial [Capra hircus]
IRPLQGQDGTPAPSGRVWPGASRRCAEPGFHERATLARVARGTVARPTWRTREGWRRLSGTRGRAPRTGWAGRTLPTAGRQARVSRQQPAKGKKKSRGKPRGKKQKKPEVDILSPAAMLNLYYIAHNVADCLQLRGFRWPGAAKAKKGKGKT